MKRLIILALCLLPSFLFGQQIPKNAQLGQPNPYPFITSALLQVHQTAMKSRRQATAQAQTMAMPVQGEQVYVEIIRGAVTDIDKTIDPDKLGATLGIKINSAYKNRASAWVPVDQLLRIGQKLPEGYLLQEVVLPEQDNQGPGLTNSDDYDGTGLGGDGLRIAVFDSEYTGLSAARAAGAAPTVANSTQLDYTGSATFEDGGSHGTSCLETTFDHAPNAEYFIMKINSISDAGNAVQDCIDNGVDVITHSLSRYNTGWDDGTGPMCAAAEEAAEAGILFFTSAGNRNNSHYQSFPVNQDNDIWHNFATFDEQNDFTLFGSPGNTALVQAYLQWDSPSTVDHYDLFLYENETNVLLDSSTNTNGFEFLSYAVEEVQDVYLAVRIKTANPPEFELFNHGRGAADFEYAQTGSSTTSPSNALHPNVISVGALPRFDYNSPEGTDGIIAGYSSRGPTNSGNLAPDICAPTNTSVTSGSFGGTSCATPNAAGVAAAFWSAHPQLSAEGVRHILFRKAALYKDWGIPGPDFTYGRGGVFLYDYHPLNRYIMREAGNVWGFPWLPYYNVSSVEDNPTIPADLRMVHLDLIDRVEDANKVFDKPMLYRSIGGTLIRQGRPVRPGFDAQQQPQPNNEPAVETRDTPEAEPVPAASALRAQIYPNPFQSQFTLELQLEQPGPLRIDLYNANGQLAAELFATGQAPAGQFQQTFRLGELPPGLYFARLTAGQHSEAIKLLKQ
jgi:subtilisin family serine protease